MMNIGLCSISFRKNSISEIISACYENGIGYIEWGSDVHAPKDDTEKLEQIANEQEKFNIKCESYGSYFRIGQNEASEFPDYVRAAKILGAKTIRVWCGTKDAEEYSECEKEALFKECVFLAEYAKKENITICTEFHRGTFTNSLENAKLLLDSVKSEHFKTYWQPNQFKSFEHNLSCAEAISGYTQNIHVFNWQESLKLPLELAKNEWKSYLDCFKGSGVALLEFMPDDDIASLKNEAKTLKAIIGEQI